MLPLHPSLSQSTTTTFALLFLLFLLHHVHHASAASLLITEARVKSPKSAVLSHGFNYCPSSFSSSPISIRCAGSDLSPPVSFFVNNVKVRVENFAPYTIAGDSAGVSSPWNPPGGGQQVTISCTSSTSAKVSVTGSFKCGPANNPQPPPVSPPVSPPAPTGTSITGNFQLINVQGTKPTKRHEGGSVYAGGKVYVMGGRRTQAMYSFDPKTSKWTNLGFPPVGPEYNYEIHHFQAVAIGNNIYIPAAWYGRYPTEKAHPNMFIYNINTKKWTTGPNIPAKRRRGGAAVAAYKGKIYVGAGSSSGHGPATKLLPYFDVYDPANPSQGWKALPNVPHMRDHTGGAVVGDYFCIGGGRRGSEQKFLEFSTLPIDCYNFNSGKWEVKKSLAKEHGRSGVGVTSCKGKLLIAGGESPGKATNRVEVFNPLSNTFDAPKFMVEKRHGINAVAGGGKVYAACGAGNAGGGPELDSIEAMTC